MDNIISKYLKLNGGFNPSTIIDDEKLFLVNGEAEIINYQYVWFQLNKDKSAFQTISDDIHLKILKDVILKYSFPCCNNHPESLTIEEKILIVSDEYTIIKNKVSEISKEIQIIRIPRIIYDLVINEYVTFLPQLKEIKINFDYSYDFTEYQAKLDDFYSRDILLKGIIEVNKLFTKYIKFDMIDDLLTKSPFGIYSKIFDDVFNFQISKEMFDNNKIKVLDDITSPRFSNILKQSLMIECGYLYNFESKKYENNTKKNVFLLYRGSSNKKEKETTISYKREKDILIDDNSRLHSISYNTSLLNGLYNDTQKEGANTYQYYAPEKHKLYYVFNKFIKGDKSPAEKLLFIPPVHPFLLLFANGELWHARTYISKDYSNYLLYKQGKSRYPVQGLGKEDVPEILISSLDKDKFESEYQAMANQSNARNVFINSLYKKYLKYKMKYLNLKSSLKKLKNNIY
jgi:hypothetical protein